MRKLELLIETISVVKELEYLEKSLIEEMRIKNDIYNYFNCFNYIFN